MDEVMEYVMSPITPEDRRNWKGWCELESEPVGIFILSSFLVEVLALVYDWCTASQLSSSGNAMKTLEKS